MEIEALLPLKVYPHAPKIPFEKRKKEIKMTIDSQGDNE